MRASNNTTGLVAVMGRAAIRPKSAARMNMVAESASQSSFKLPPKNGARSDVATAARVRLNAAACEAPPIVISNEEKASRNLGACVVMALSPCFDSIGLRGHPIWAIDPHRQKYLQRAGQVLLPERLKHRGKAGANPRVAKLIAAQSRRNEDELLRFVEVVGSIFCALVFVRNFFTTSAVSAPVGTAPAMIGATTEMHSGHMVPPPLNSATTHKQGRRGRR